MDFFVSYYKLTYKYGQHDDADWHAPGGYNQDEEGGEERKEEENDNRGEERDPEYTIDTGNWAQDILHAKKTSYNLNLIIFNYTTGVSLAELS